MRQRPPRPPRSSRQSAAHAPTDDERALFRAAVADVVPLRGDDRVVHEPPRPAPRPRQREHDEAAAIAESLHGPLAVDDLLDLDDADVFLRDGLPRTVLRDLRSGRWAIQGHLDLHGLNRHEAHAAVGDFLATALLDGKRCLRIVHGRGRGSPGREGVLRRLVKAWLARRQDVLAFCQAPPRDGGEGALWLLLRAGR